MTCAAIRPEAADEAPRFAVRSYRPSNRHAVRVIYGDDEFARPRLVLKYPRLREYLAGEASCYYTDYRPKPLL